MGREARIKAAKAKRDRDAFLASDKGKAAVEEAKQKWIDSRAVEIGSEIINAAKEHAREKSINALVRYWRQRDVYALLELVPTIYARAIENLPQAGMEMQRLAGTLSEAREIVLQQIDLARQAAHKAKIEDRYVHEAHIAAHRGFAWALAELFAQVSSWAPTEAELEWVTREVLPGATIASAPAPEGEG